MGFFYLNNRSIVDCIHMEPSTLTRPDYKSLALESRLKVLDLVYKAQTSHIGSLMGAADLFAVIFSKINLDQDKFILSAGWKAALLYFHLWKLGRITESELDSYCQPGSKWIGLAEPIHPDIPFAGGSMGYGLPAAVGFALAKKLKGEEGRVYCYMSDAEVGIGTYWEAMLIANQHKLDNLTVIIEFNGLQAMGSIEEILDTHLEVLTPIDGHNFEELEKAVFKTCEHIIAVIAKTTKGKGVSFMENNNLYHYKALSDEEYQAAKRELNAI